MCGVRSESRAGLFLLGRSLIKKKDAGPHSGEAEPEPGQGSEGACQAPRSGMPLNMCVPGRLAHVQDESAPAPSDNVWHEIKSMAFK